MPSGVRGLLSIWLQELFGCFRGGVHFSIDEDSPRVRPARAIELPGYGVTFTREFRPPRIFGGVLLNPEASVLICNGSQVRMAQPFGPSGYVGERRLGLWHRFNLVNPAYS